METKLCSKCGEVKSLDQFHRDKSSKDGRVPRCKRCRQIDKAEYYSQNRETLLAYQTEYYQENRDTLRAYKAERHARPEVKARHAEYMAEYYQANPHIWWEYAYRKRARAYGFDPRVSSFTRGELIEAHGDRCVHCGGPFESLDHYPTPVSRGGEHSLENCRPSCMNCQQLSWREDFTPTNTLKETA